MGRYTRKGYELDQTGQEAQDLLNAINNKVDKEDGKSLISDEDKAKLDDIEEGAQRNAIETIKRNGVALPIDDKGVNISVPTKVADLEQDYTHRTVTDAEKDKWNDKQEKPAPVRYAVLKSMRDTGGLTVGKTYRITDYVATVRRSAQYSEAMSANHPFDIIVTAIDERHLSEECLAAIHEGDIYFANSDLTAWKIWYTIDNDTATYDWADPINGKGVIYRMIDEYANDLGYDFKGILIARHPVAPAEGYENVLSDISGMWLGINSSALPAGIMVDTTQTKWFYTFSHLTDGWDNPTDASLRKGISAVYNVTITPIMRSNSRFLSGNVFMGGPFVVSTLVAMGASVEEVGTSHAMHFRAMGDCSGNSFFGYTGSSDCMSQLRHNIFVGEFRHNRFATDVEGNTIVAPDDISFNDMWCANMVVRARVFSYNSGGGYTLGTVLKTSENVSYNKFPNYFADNRITAAGNISANDFGTSFYRNTFTLTGQFTGNKFTGYCYENNIGCSNFTNNEAAYFHANTISTTEGVNACVFGPYFESNTLGGRLTNVRFSSGQTRFCNFSGIVGCTFDGIMEYVTVPTVSGKRFTHCDVRGGVRGTSSVPVVLDYDAFFLASAAGVSRRVTIEGSADGKIVAMWADGGALKGVMKAPNGNWADMGFVTKAVNDLLNYYLKSETYTKTEVNQLVAGINNWEIVSVAQLPEASADTMHKIYLVPSSSPEASNVKDEYITIENSGIYSWEQIGSTTIDLTNYVTKQEFTIALADYVTSSAFTQALATKQDTLVSGQNIKTINGFSILGGGDLYFPGPVQSDWNEDDDGDDAYIKNKPTIPTNVVKYTEQELTEAQKTQARTNIAAASESEVSQLRSEVDKIAIPTTETGKIINTSGTIGSVVPAPQPVSGYRYMKFPVMEGDIVIVNAKGGSAPRAWAFVDSSDQLLSQAPYSSAIVSVTLTAPGNAAAVIINDSSDSTSYYISKTSISYRLSKIGASQIEENGLFKTTVVGGDGTSQDIVGKVSLATYYTPDASVTQIATYEGCIEEIWVDPRYLSPFNLKFASFTFYGIKAWLMAKTARNLSPTWTANVDLREKTNGEIIPLTVSSSTILGVPSGTVVGYVIFSDISTFQATPFTGSTALLNLPRAISLDYNRLIWLNIMMTSASVDAKVLAAVTGGISPLIPSLIYATVGVQLNLYNDAVCLSMDRGLMSPMNYIVQWGCNKGIVTDRCFRWTPTADEVGDTAITCSVYTPSGVLIQSASSIIRVKVASIESAKRVVFFGDSTGAGSAAALSADFDDAGLFSGIKPTMLGIRGTTTKYEAFGGARWADYATEGRAAYRCQVSGVGAIALNSQYTNNGFTWTVVEVNVMEGTGNILITKNDLYSSTDAPQTAGTLVPVGGGENVAYTGATKEAGNPLWYNNAIDFSHYRNTLGLGANEKLDLVSFQLGLNGYYEDGATLRQYIIDLYTAAVADNPNCIFLIGLVTGPCNTVDAYGVNYGAGDWMTTIRRYHAKRKVYEELAESGDYPNMRIATPNLNIDRYYGFPLGTRAVSARNNTEEQYHTNFVHPSESGYAQIGDAFFAAYIATLNE